MPVAYDQLGLNGGSTERKNGVILTKKIESLVELKFDKGFRIIGEYLSQIDLILRVNSN